MYKQTSKAVALLMAATMTMGSVSFVFAATPSDGEKNQTGTSSYLTAGVSQVMSNCLTEDAQAKVTIAENELDKVTANFSEMAVSNVNQYVNIRTSPDMNSEVAGKLYSKSVATVLETLDGWYKITSGSVTGYVKAEYLIVGDQEAVKSVGTPYAYVITQTLKIRKEASTESEVLGLVASGEKLQVVEQTTDGWVGVFTKDGLGYVSSDFVSFNYEFKYAESKAEESARLAAEAAKKAAASKKPSGSSSSGGSSSGSSRPYNPPSGSNGQAVANYACQFVGNPYRAGGTSLTDGADCSGFVKSVYAAFGVSLPHSSYSLRSVGYGVSVSEMQPGDIICYSGHVAIYVGNNTIVHASNSQAYPKGGIKYTSPANYKTILAVRRIF